jgi:predicted phosphohydrolase
MDIFSGWDDHAERLIENWKKKITDDDTVVLVGDTSWGQSLPEATPDFRLIHKLPGKRKILLKGNHDHWWGSVTKMNETFAEHELSSLCILHNNSYEIEGKQVCGSRGWLFETGEPRDEKLIRREAIRIEASLKSATGTGEKVLFLHYPPVYAGQVQDAFVNLMLKYGIKRCYYGHIHGAGHKYAVQGNYRGVQLTMIASDYLGFDPLRVD